MREEVMNAVDSSKFITIARDSMKGSISKTDPFLIKEKGLEAGVKTAAPIAAKSGVKQMAETVVGVKTLKGFGVAGKVTNAMKRSFNPVTKIMGTALSGTVKAGRSSSRAVSLSVSKMSELASKGLDKGDERALVR